MNAKDMSADELEGRMLRLSEDMAKIRAQVGAAKAKAASTGDYSDSSWFQRANLALRLKGKEQQELQLEIGRRRREERRLHNENMNQAFIDVARKRLDPVTFRSLWDEALSS